MPISEAEPILQPIRRQHTEDGAQGAPPHVTLLHPFTDTARLSEERIREVAAIVSGFSNFEYSLSTVA